MELLPNKSRKFGTNGKVLYRSFREVCRFLHPEPSNFCWHIWGILRCPNVKRENIQTRIPVAHVFNRGGDPFGCEEFGFNSRIPRIWWMASESIKSRKLLNWKYRWGTQLGPNSWHQVNLEKKLSVQSSGHLSTRSINCGCSCRKYVVASGKIHGD